MEQSVVVLRLARELKMKCRDHVHLPRRTRAITTMLALALDHNLA